VAYRSRSRPSSTLGAKASTVCPYYLDGDLTQHDPMLAVMRGPVIPVEPASKRQAPVSAAAYRWRLMWLLCSFQGPWRGISRRPGSRSSSTPLCGVYTRAPADAGLSKLNSMLGSLCGRRRRGSRSSTGALPARPLAPFGAQPARFGRHARPGPLDTHMPRGPYGTRDGMWAARASSCEGPRTGAPLGAP
jgi:hypothetical protein